MKKFSAAVVGLGYWGPNILRNVIEIDEFKDVYCCDLDRSRLEMINKRFQFTKLEDNFDYILNNSDIKYVFISTPPITHYKLAKKAMENGKNVYIEKPMTTSSGEAKELIGIAKKNSVKLMVGHTFEFSPAVEKIGELIGKGVLGDLYFISMSRINLGIHQKDISVIWDLAPHDFSILFKLLNENPYKISAFSNSFVKESLKDVAFINIRFKSGIIANINVSWLSPNKVRETIIVGKKKMLIYNDTHSDEKIKIFDKGVDLVRDPENFGEYQLTYRTGNIVSPFLETTEPLKLAIKHFIDSVDNDFEPKTDGYCGLRVVKAVEAAERSSERDGEVIVIDDWK
ncbi:MAG: Gfo/Idh/MocA family oxidoreductase [Actinobacteria bacterium]|nr:Gfo/Idh/MocA family oxidoreductase [Actinomycetota bacterium]